MGHRARISSGIILWQRFGYVMAARYAAHDKVKSAGTEYLSQMELGVGCRDSRRRWRLFVFYRPWTEVIIKKRDSPDKSTGVQRSADPWLKPTSNRETRARRVRIKEAPGINT